MQMAKAKDSKQIEATQKNTKYQSMRLNWIEFRVRTSSALRWEMRERGKKQQQKQNKIYKKQNKKQVS